MTDGITKRISTGKQIVFYTLILIAALGMLYPILWMISSSLKPEADIFTQVGLIPKRITFENYVTGWAGTSGITFTTYYKNTLVMVIIAIIGNVFSCTLTAYAFARLDFRFKSVLFGLLMATIMLPQHASLIPQYMLFDKLDWLNSIKPIVVPKFFATDAFFCFLLVQFIKGLPRELDQAASIDGCGEFGIFSRIIVPLMLPAIVTVTIFTFLWTWNDFFFQLIYINNPNKFTIALGLRSFLDATGKSSYGSLLAMSLTSIIPILLLFIFFQKLLIEGIATSGLKG